MRKILFFDGVCVMCNGLIDFAMRHDIHHRYFFASLQGETAQKFIPGDLVSNLNTVVLLDEDKIYTESDAVINLLAGFGGIFKLIIILKIFPKFLRNYTYKFIAKNRYSWFGQAESCRLPTKEERARMLD